MASRASNEVPASFEGGEVKGFDFTEQSIRKSFLKKVYSLLMCQLLVTMSFITLFVFCDPVKNWAADPSKTSGRVMTWMVLGVVIVCFMVMACCEGVRRKSPINLVFFGIFTIAESFLLGVLSSRYNTQMVMMAVGVAAGICFTLTLFAFQTKLDFTLCGGILVCTTLLLLTFGTTAIFLQDRKLHLLYGGLGTLLFSFCLVFDTQLMLEGEHKYSISPEEYIFAALTLYLDIINVFLYILSFGRK